MVAFFVPARLLTDDRTYEHEACRPDLVSRQRVTEKRKVRKERICRQKASVENHFEPTLDIKGMANDSKVEGQNGQFAPPISPTCERDSKLPQKPDRQPCQLGHRARMHRL